MDYLFKDRESAGRDLAFSLERYRGANPLVLGLPRGGVVVASQVARGLNADLNVILTRKIGAPGNPEYAIGAVAEPDVVVLNSLEISALGITSDWLDAEINCQREIIRQRIQLFRGGAPLPPLQNRPVLVVDDGVATGFTMLAAIRSVRQSGAHPVVMATPVCPANTLDRLSEECDDTVVLATPSVFYSVGFFYENFDQVTDDEVVQILRSGGRRAAA